MTAERVRIGVLASGTGTNFQALLDADISPAAVVLLLTDVPDAPVVGRASTAGVPFHTLDRRLFAGRSAFEAATLSALRSHRVDWVVLAGFMRILSRGFIEAYDGRILNIHPALCPSFPGRDAQQQALDAGVKITGCTVHLVDAGIDSGPILAQAAVPVLPGDDRATLAARILREEHALLPAVVRAIARAGLRRDGLGRPAIEPALDLSDTPPEPLSGSLRCPPGLFTPTPTTAAQG